MAIASILIANRGEIASRVIRTARSLGLRTVAIYTEADRDAPYVQEADEAAFIGEGPVAESYLNIQKVLSVAKDRGVDAIHPGYGFLSENAEFAEAVAAAGIVFIGPPASAIRDMGDKAEAKRRMIAAGVPCVPGYQGEDQTDAALIAAAGDIGFPIMAKASAGGGGRGMRLVNDPDALPDALALARAEAKGAFGSDVLILEKAILRPRHVEIQIFADAHGNVIHFGERDCSVQRRHQKVVEEAPCPVMTPGLRAEMGAAACAAARAVAYLGAGTVEFLLDEAGAFYFLEMNTRLQVEHPVTEMVTGVDLVALQIAVANGEALPMTQDEVALKGHAIEVRLYAEDPANDFLPDTGWIDLWRPSTGEGVRTDGGIAEGQSISPYYDPMLAKVIAHGPTRDVARARLTGALKDTALLGPANNAAFLVDVLERDGFATGAATTAFLADEFPDGVAVVQASDRDIALAAAFLLTGARDASFAKAGYVSRNLLGWSSSQVAPTPLTLEINGDEHTVAATAVGDDWRVAVGAEAYLVTLDRSDPPRVRATVGGERIDCFAADGADDALRLSVNARSLLARRKGSAAADAETASGRITAPMPGLVVEVRVKDGDTVEPGDVLAILEAMKMQHRIEAPVGGTVALVATAPDARISAGDLIVEIEEG